MKIVFFVHSIISDWNNGHAHFLRGLMKSLMKVGHEVLSCEKMKNWSTDNLLEDHGVGPLVEFARLFPEIRMKTYKGGRHIVEEVDALTTGADLVIVHEFNEPELIGAAGYIRRSRGDFVLLFHDTHHRAVSLPYSIATLNLSAYDGVLAFGQSLCNVYRTRFDVNRVWPFHEAADTGLFRPLEREKAQDVVWIGNWGDEERSEETRAFLIGSARSLKHLRFAVYGVRYPREAIEDLREAGIEYRNWLPNYRVPEVFAGSNMTIHIPRFYYRKTLGGIPTIRPFEALACGIPLICTPWDDREQLFRPGKDYLVAENPGDMYRLIAHLSENPEKRASLSEAGLQTIRARHTCDHRAAQLMKIYEACV